MCAPPPRHACTRVEAWNIPATAAAGQRRRYAAGGVSCRSGHQQPPARVRGGRRFAIEAPSARLEPMERPAITMERDAMAVIAGRVGRTAPARSQCGATPASIAPPTARTRWPLAPTPRRQRIGAQRAERDVARRSATTAPSALTEYQAASGVSVAVPFDDEHHHREMTPSAVAKRRPATSPPARRRASARAERRRRARSESSAPPSRRNDESVKFGSAQDANANATRLMATP